jgi:phage shock protein E
MFKFLKNIFSSNNGELRNFIAQGAFLVDVRTPHEFDSGNVKGSINIPLDRIQHQINQFKNKKHIIVFCASGMRSAQAKSILISNGINNVTNGKMWRKIAALKSA